MKILVSGPTSFVGKNLIKYLAEKNEVHALYREAFRICFSEREVFRRCSMLNVGVPVTFNDTHDNYDMIIHAASPADPAVVANNYKGVYDANITLTQKLIGIAGRSKARFVYISSGEVYGQNNTLLKENYNLSVSPGNHYAAAKIAGENISMTYRDTVIVRLFHTYGAGQRMNDSRVPFAFCKMAVDEKKIEIKSDGSAVRSFCYIDDAVRGIATVAEKGTNQIYNIGNGNEVYRIIEVAEIIQELTGCSYRVGSGVSGIPRAVPDTSKAKSLGWVPVIDLHSGLKLTLNYIKG